LKIAELAGEGQKIFMVVIFAFHKGKTAMHVATMGLLTVTCSINAALSEEALIINMATLRTKRQEY
jgi:hypothetical protein